MKALWMIRMSVRASVRVYCHLWTCVTNGVSEWTQCVSRRCIQMKNSRKSNLKPKAAKFKLKLIKSKPKRKQNSARWGGGKQGLICQCFSVSCVERESCESVSIRYTRVESMKLWTMKVQLTRSRALNYKMRSANEQAEGSRATGCQVCRSARSPSIDSSNNNKNTAAAAPTVAATNRSKIPRCGRRQRQWPELSRAVPSCASVHPVGFLNRFLERCSRYVLQLERRLASALFLHLPLAALPTFASLAPWEAAFVAARVH